MTTRHIRWSVPELWESNRLNKYAISSEGVGEALLRSASAMEAANNTLDETIALATSMNTVVDFVPPCLVTNCKKDDSKRWNSGGTDNTVGKICNITKSRNEQSVMVTLHICHPLETGEGVL